MHTLYCKDNSPLSSYSCCWAGAVHHICLRCDERFLLHNYLLWDWSIATVNLKVVVSLTSRTLLLGTHKDQKQWFALILTKHAKGSDEWWKDNTYICLSGYVIAKYFWELSTAWCCTHTWLIFCFSLHPTPCISTSWSCTCTTVVPFLCALL